MMTTNAQPHNRIALVTGAGSGVGRASACALVADGWRVVFSGRRLDALRHSIEQAGDPFDDIASRALAAPVDVTRPDSVAALFDFVRARFGRLDLLFNQAAVRSPVEALDKVTLADWKLALDTQLTGSFLCTQKAFALMKSQQPRGGRIILGGHVSSPGVPPQSVADTTTRHGLSGLSLAAALQGRGHGVAVSQIDLGPRTRTTDPRAAARAVLQLANVEPDAEVLHQLVLADNAR